MSHARRVLTVPCLALVLAACGTAADDAKVDSGASATTSAAGETDGAPTERPLKAHVVLTGGTHAGTYDYTEPDAMCAGGDAGIEEVSLNFAHSDPSDKPGTIQNVSFGADQISAARTGSDKFGLAMDVTNGAGVSRSIQLAPNRNAGAGTTTIAGQFPVFTAKVQGTTADGVKVDATLECARSK